MRKWIIFTVVLLCASAAPAPGQESDKAKCNQAIDWVVQARERARPGLSKRQLEEIKSRLDSATRYCSDYGDAWYYRALYARQLGEKKDEKYAMDKAEQYGAEALRYRDNPFAPAAPVVVSAPTTSPASGTSPPAGGPAKPEAKVPALRPVREKWALVVGIGQFRDQKITRLRYTTKDARNFAELLTDPNVGRFKPANVTVLTDEQATVKDIKAAIGRLMDNAHPDDLVVCYISTHGSPRAGGQAGVNYIVAHDTDTGSLYATSLAMVNIVDDFSKLVRAQRVALFLDTCYAGAAALGLSGGDVTSSGVKSLEVVSAGVSQDLLGRVDQTAGRVIISASKENEESYESVSLKNSIFTYYLMEALKLENGQAKIEQVYRHLKKQVSNHVSSERGARVSQTPVMHGNTLQGQIDIRIGVAPQPR